MSEGATGRIKKRMPTWRIYRKLAGQAFFLEVVEAPDTRLALQTAIKAYQIPKEDHDRLIAEKRE